MRNVYGTLLIIACAVFAGCSSNLSCDEPERYQSARPGTRIQTPEDLDNLEASKEMTVPQASPREARPEGSPCLDRPPVLRVES